MEVWLVCFLGTAVAAADGEATGSVPELALTGVVLGVAATGTVDGEVIVALCATGLVTGVAEVATGFGAGVETLATGFGLGGVTFATAFFRPPKSGSLFHVVCNAAGAGFPEGTCVELIFVAGAAGCAAAVAVAFFAGACSGLAFAVGAGVGFGVGAGLGAAIGLTGVGAGVAG